MTEQLHRPDLDAIEQRHCPLPSSETYGFIPMRYDLRQVLEYTRALEAAAQAVLDVVATCERCRLDQSAVVTLRALLHDEPIAKIHKHDAAFREGD